MASYEEAESKIKRFDKRIEEISEQTKYHEKEKRLGWQQIQRTAFRN